MWLLNLKKMHTGHQNIGFQIGKLCELPYAMRYRGDVLLFLYIKLKLVQLHLIDFQ